MLCLPHHWAHWAIALTVLLWTLPGALLRPSALVLTLGWALASDYRCASGLALDVPTSLAIDAGQILLVAWCGWPVWQPAARQELIVLLLFPLFWIVYALQIDAFYAWWLKWAIQMVQLLAVGPWLLVGRHFEALRVDPGRMQMGGGT